MSSRATPTSSSIFLSRLGLIDESRFAIFGLPIGRIFLSNLNYLFLCSALIVMIARKRVR